MAEVAIRRLEARYHLPPSRPEKARLDAVLHRILDGALEAALDRAGVLSWEQVCIRRLHVPVRLNLALADAALVEAWTAALAGALVRAAIHGPTPDLVRYRTRTQALFDVAVSLAQERFDRVWAWRLAGVWRGGEAPFAAAAAAEWVAAACAAPEAIAALLEALAASSTLPAPSQRRLWRILAAPHWERLAHAALRASGIGATPLDDRDGPYTAEAAALAQAALRASALARALRGTAVLESPATLRAIAALIALQHEPGGLARDTGLVREVARLLHPAAAQATTLVARRPRPPATVDDADAPILLVAQQAFTRHGGLLFLLGLVPVEDLLARFERRPFRWVLHQLALTLVATEAADPAALAFAGLPPDAEPPSLDGRPPDEAERAALDGFAAAIERVVAALLEMPHPLPFLCQREAEIVADPGWIAIHFRLRDVSTVVRRAGLDLDPGWLPWLGVVVRFVYA